MDLFSRRGVVSIPSEQVHVFTDIEVLAVCSTSLHQYEVGALFHGLAVVGPVPAFGSYIVPFVEFLSPTVENVGVELLNVLILLGFERIVDSVIVG